MKMFGLLLIWLGWAAASGFGESTNPVFAAEGHMAPAWEVTDWINSRPLTVEQLRGKVVLVRWWTAPDCPYCQASAPALNEFAARYKSAGFQVIGFYHHKAKKPLQVSEVNKYVDAYGFKFPVAIDRRWRTLRHWWLDSGKKDWTSVSFLIDRHGVIRFIHPGGQYVKGDESYQELKSKIDELIAEK